MTEWNAEAVTAAANEWAWIPEGAPHVRTTDYLIIHYPDWFAMPTTARSLGSVRDAAPVIDQAHAIARGWGRDRVWWVVSDLGPAPEVERELLRRGARVTERTDILALPLDQGLPDLGVPDEIDVVHVVDEWAMRDALAVESQAFGSEPAGDEQLADALSEMARSATDGSGARFVAYLDGVPVGFGGWTRAGRVGRLWGAGTTPAARGRGAYRAVLDARLRAAVEAGCTLGLAHGRVNTSSPILQRVGFRRYGEQRTLRLELR